ncbi:hypothetical protein DFH09DRAFT_1083572 [Mycena vulgaris]|nr:hypothetical protein DFH09DRAFT_1083572 [Mycena vulgaris]
MAEYESCSAVLGTFELLESIVDFLHCSEDLKSCALTFRTFTFHAQSNLFHKITLSKSSTSAATRLREIMDASPHLRCLVRRATVAVELAMLTRLAGIGLVRMTHLRLVGGSLDVDALSAVQDLTSLPSLRTLVLEVTVPDRASLNVLLSRCGPSLRMLCFSAVTLASKVELPHLAPVQVVRLQVSHLMLVRTSAAIAAWLLDPHCLLDLSHLQSGTLFMVSSPAIVEAFSAAHATITSLTIHPNYNANPSAPVEATRGFALSDLRRLTKWHPYAPAVLEVLILASAGSEVDSLVADGAFARTDSLLSGMHLPALKRVELRLLLPHPAPGADPTAAIAAITIGFVHIQQRESLVVCDITGAGSLISFAFLTNLPFVLDWIFVIVVNTKTGAAKHNRNNFIGRATYICNTASMRLSGLTRLISSGSSYPVCPRSHLRMPKDGERESSESPSIPHRTGARSEEGENNQVTDGPPPQFA